MRLSTKGRYAVVAMIDLALRDHAGLVALSSISARQQVSMSYLEQLFGRLRRCQLVESTRGPGGGYALGRNPERITVADIIRAVDDPAPVPNGITTAAARTQLPVASRWKSFGHASTRRRSSVWKTSPCTNCWSSSA